MKILMVISDTNIGGAGKWIMEYFRYADRNRFTIKAVIPTGSQLKQLYTDCGLAVIECDGIADRSFSTDGIQNLKKIFKAEKPDIVHSHGTMSARIAAKLPFSGVKKVVFTRHSVFEPKGFFTTPVGKIVNRLIHTFTCDKITAVCEAAKKNLTDTGVDPKKIQVIYNGVDAIPAPTPAQRAEARKEFGILDSEIACTISARLNPVKGHRYLVEAIHRMSSLDNMKFFIAGTGTEEVALKAMVQQYNLEEKVIFTGFLSDVSKLLYATDILLNCSYGTEACSLAILEGFSLGIPCIATDYGGNPELVKNKINGIVYPTNDVEALKEALESIQSERCQIETLSVGAKETYQRGFTVQIMAKNIEKVYEELIYE
ncbi:MAG: glycosyltransferase [Clostridia bacterium]|nr:glycosyltransferase [Clostridia bacterium]